jgi:hypothetical protein
MTKTCSGDLAVLQDEAKLEGLHPATKTEVTGKGGGPHAAVGKVTTNTALRA